MCNLCPLWNLGEPITSLSRHGLHGSDIGKKKKDTTLLSLQCPFCTPLTIQLSVPFFFPSRNFSIFFRSSPFSHRPPVCLSRASIVQKRIIYFQDEGSLTIRLCEKGNDSCPSSSLPLPRWSFHPRPLIVVPLSLVLSSVPPPTHTQKNRRTVFHTVVKKRYKTKRTSRKNCDDNESHISWESKRNLDIALNFTTEHHCSTVFTVPVHCWERRRVWKAAHSPNKHPTLAETVRRRDSLRSDAHPYCTIKTRAWTNGFQNSISGEFHFHKISPLLKKKKKKSNFPGYYASQSSQPVFNLLTHSAIT